MRHLMLAVALLLAALLTTYVLSVVFEMRAEQTVGQ